MQNYAQFSVRLPAFSHRIRPNEKLEEILLEHTDHSGMKLTTLSKILLNAKILLSLGKGFYGWSIRRTGLGMADRSRRQSLWVFK